MRLDWGSNPQPFNYRMALQPTEPRRPGPKSTFRTLLITLENFLVPRFQMVQYSDVLASAADCVPQTDSAEEPLGCPPPPPPPGPGGSPRPGSVSGLPAPADPATLGGNALCSPRGRIREGRVFPMNHNHSRSQPSPLPSPHRHFLICKIRSRSPENLDLVVRADSAEGVALAGSDLCWAEPASWRLLVPAEARGLFLTGPDLQLQARSPTLSDSSRAGSLPLCSLPSLVKGRALCLDTHRPQRGLRAWVTSWSFAQTGNKQRVELAC